MRSLKYYYLRIKRDLSKRDMFNYAYYLQRNKMPNYKNPSNLSEYILSESLKGNINNYSFFADKYNVRDYIISKGYDYLLVKLIKVFYDVNSFEMKDLPEKYVIKLNNGCGFNIVNYGIKLNEDEVKRKLTKWFRPTSYKYEEHYNLIEPIIMVEEFIQDKNPKLQIPRDYKFMCYKGRVKCILVVDDRDPLTGSGKLSAFDTSWNLKNEYLTNEGFQIDKPNKLEEMILIAENLSSDFNFVRVDLYDSKDGILFGELTFTPAMGIMGYFTENGLKEMFTIDDKL